jgi:hypothetical protein
MRSRSSIIILNIIFLFIIDSVVAQTQLGSDIDGEAASDQSGQSISINSDGDRVAIGANKNDGTGTDMGHVRVYSYSNGSWSQMGSDIDGEANSDRSGNAVSLDSDGDRVAIGGYFNDGTGTEAGHVRVYEYSSGSWSQLGNGLDISNLPYSQEGSIAIPLDVMYLTVDDDYNFVTIENDVTMSWDLSSLPETIIGLTLTDNTTNATTDLLQSEELTFTTIAKGSFPAYGSNGVNIYPQVGESQFTLSVAYSALTTNDDMMPKEFALHPAYPNPFNPSTMISFDVPELQNISVQIFNITGQLIETLINGNIESGKHEVIWDAGNLPSGIYFVQLKSGEKTITQKLTLLK